MSCYLYAKTCKGVFDNGVDILGIRDMRDDVFINQKPGMIQCSSLIRVFISILLDSMTVFQAVL